MRCVDRHGLVSAHSSLQYPTITPPCATLVECLLYPAQKLRVQPSGHVALVGQGYTTRLAEAVRHSISLSEVEAFLERFNPQLHQEMQVGCGASSDIQ
jgi:hypothetical protein